MTRYLSASSYDSHSIAVIGLACRFPGDASSPEKFWDLLCKGRSAVSKIPDNRWNVDAFHHPIKGRLNTSITERGHFLSQDITAFDANFFTMSRAEAIGMDPQQRFMLEISYEAFENAGIPMEKLAGTQTGCYVGGFTQDWREMQFRDPDSAPLYAFPGIGIELLANRLSWFYDLRGPSMTLETACSSSLVSLHIACQSLRVGESKMALVGGANIFLNPDMFGVLSNQQFLSPDGLCKAFDASANGYSRGEGFAAVILKPIEDAIRDGDTIRAVIRGTGSNQDGKTKGITMPSSDAQEALIRSTYHAAGLEFKDTNYFEAHGTGTSAGDFAELSAISRTIGSQREEGKKIFVGSVKTNIGHLESVAGLAGLIKGIYILENALIPANLHFKNPNPRIPFAEWKIAVPTALTPWPYEGLRRLSVNSFGYGGANAHAILDDAYHYLAKRGLKANHCTTAPSSAGLLRALKWSERVNGHVVNGSVVAKANGTKVQKPTRLIVFSTQDQDGLARQRQDMSTYLEKHTSGKTDTDTILRDLAFTLSEKRSRLPWKSYCITSSTGELMQSLENKDHPSVRSTLEPRLGFVFTGQGAQWAKMGIELLRYNVFRQSVEAADKYLKQGLGCRWSALEELSRDDATSNINLPSYSQTLCTVLQVALVELLESWKISPRSVVGHSSGEIAAAYCIGSLSRENAWKVAYYRGTLSSQMKSIVPTLKGAMLAVGTSETQARKWIARVTRGDTVIACINSPSSVTVSGDETGIDELAAMLKKDGIFARKLKVETAYHSHHMNSIAIPYFEALRDVIPTEALPGRQMFTSVSGSLVDFSELGAAHWVRNLLSPVLFSDALYELVRPKEAEDQATGAAVDMLVEIGPHSALQGPVSQILKKHGIKDVEYRSMLSRGRDGVQTSLTAAGEMFTHGVPVDINTLNLGAEIEDHFSGSPKTLVDMPTYAWNHSRTYWAESRVAKHYRLREYPRLSLVGAPYPAFGESERQWRGFLRISEEPWIRDHKIQSSILYPAAGFLAMAIEGASQIADPSLVVREFRLREIQISSAVVLNEESDLECILQFRPHATGTRDNSGAWLEFNVSTCPEGEDPRRNCSGLLVIEYESAVNSSMNMERALEEQACKNQYYEARTTCRTLEDTTDFYKDLESIGLVYGPTFRNLSEIRISEQGLSCCAVGVVDTGSTPVSRWPDRPHIIHPTVLDAMFHAAFAALKGRQGTLSEAMVPKFIEEVVVAADIGFQTGTRFRGYSTSAKHGFRELVSNIHMLDDSLSKQVVAIKGFNCAEVSSSMTDASDEETIMNEKKICSKLVWKPAIELLSAEQQKEVIEAIIPQHTPAETEAAIEKEEMMAFASICHSFEKVSSREVPTMQLRNFYKWMEDQLKKSSHSSSTVAGANGGEINTTLEQVLRGKADAKQLLKEQSLDQFYAQLRGMEESRTKLSEYIALMGHAKLDLAVLELGSVVSGAASSILASKQGVPDAIDYVYASRTSTSLQAAKEQLQLLRHSTQFSVLDIEQEPSEQGFGDKTFDLVVGCNAFDDVQSIEKALANAKKLLRPGGKLCLVELVNPGIQAMAVLGCVCSWWRKRDDQSSRPLSADELTTYLARSEFNLDFVSADFVDPLSHQTSLIVASADGPSEKSVSVEEIIIIQRTDTPETSRALAAQVSSSLEQNSVPSRTVTWGRDISSLKGKKCIALVELERPMLADLAEGDFAVLQQVITQASSLLWVTALADPAGAPVVGLARSIRNEMAGIQFRTLHLSPASLTAVPQTASLVVNVATSSTEDVEFREGAGVLQVCRLEEDVAMNEEMANFLSEGKVDLMPLERAAGPQKLCIRNPGMLDSLCFEADDLASTSLRDDEVEIEVKASALNFRDVMVCMGQIPDKLLGFEASGIITRVGQGVTKFRPGDRVCTLGHGAHRAVFRNKAIMCQAVPAGLSFEEAACLPLVHCTAYHGLINVARVKNGQSILIHAAAGGVGQAAIQLGQHFGMEIFATVGSPDKKALIQEAYGIPDDHIFNSRDLSFAKGILRMTGNRGVDCVLNSLAGEALRQTWHCLAPFGTFVEIGIKDILGNTSLDMRPFLKDTMFAALNLEHVQRARPDVMAEIIEGTFDLLRRGVTRPVTPLTVYPISEVESAFRLMQAGRHRGKIALSYSRQDVVPVLHNPSNMLNLSPNETYVLVGGLGGLGRSLSNLLVDRGARHLCFISRSGAASVSAAKVVHDLESKGVQVQVYCCDIADSQALKATIDRCSREMPRISGVIQCAMVLRDALFETMSYTQWRESLRPKIQGSWNLHALMPADLSFFISLSSFSGIFGNRGQSNYAAGGTYEDGLAHFRRAQGLRAVTIDLGIMRDVGVLAEKGAIGDLREWEEPFGIREGEFHALMKKAVYGQLTQDVPAQIVTGIPTGGMVAKAGIRRPFYFDDPKFGIMARTGNQQGGAASADGSVPLKDQLASVETVADASKVVAEALVAKVAKSLQTPTSEIDPRRPLHSYGVDSLVAVEIRNWIMKEMKSDITVFDIMASVPITTFAQNITVKSKLLQEKLSQ